MDENKNKNNEQVNEELENLAQLFQSELDKAKEEAENNPEDGLVEEIADWTPDSERKQEDESEEKTNDLDESLLCEKCGKNKRNTDISADYPYCSECREKMKRTPIAWTHVFLIIPVLFAMLVVVSFLSTTLPNFAQVGALDKLVASRRLDTASKAYYNYLNGILEEESFTPSIAALNCAENNAAKMYYSLGLDSIEISGQYVYGINYARNIITEADVLFNQTKKVSEAIENFNETVDTVSSNISAAEETYVAVCQVIDKMRSDGQKYDDAVLEFIKYNASVMYGETPSVQLEHLLKIKEINDLYYWLYEEALFQTYLVMGKYDEALEVANTSKGRNIENPIPYALEAYVYRMKGDYKKAEQLCGEVLKKVEDAEVYRQLAIVKLLQKDYDSAYKFSKLAFDKTSQIDETSNAKIVHQYGTGLEVFDVWALCCHLKNDTENYNSIIEELEYYGSYYGSDAYALSQSVVDFVDGKITLENIFLEGKGDTR